MVLAGLDLLRSTGPRHAWRRRREVSGAAKLSTALRDAVYRRIWIEAADAIGADLTELSAGALEVRRGEASTRVWQQVVGLDDPVTLRLALDKPFVHRRLAALGLPVPEHVEVDYSELRRARDFLVGGAPCVLKPASGTGGGEGTTAGVSTTAELLRAQLRASCYSSRVLVERQAAGDVYRLLYLDGELLDVVRHRPPRLAGDGRSSIGELVAAENERRLAAGGECGLSLLAANLDSVLTLAKAGLTLASVPAEGETVLVKTVTNDNRVEDSETVREPLSPDLAAAAAAAVRAVGLRLAGVDAITEDPTRPLRETGGVISDVNGTPGIHHHYHVADRAGATRVAVPILERSLA